MSETKVKHKLMILAVNSHQLVQVEKYLSRRDFEIVVLVDVKAFIIKAIQWQPDFVMIPVDHMQPSVKQLPRILAQVISSFMILYASQNSTSSLMMLKKSGNVYTVSPPITGPKVERTINKYHLDLANPEKKALIKKAQMGGSDEDLMIKIEGNKNDLRKFSVDQKTKMVLEAITGGISVDPNDAAAVAPNGETLTNNTNSLGTYQALDDQGMPFVPNMPTADLPANPSAPPHNVAESLPSAMPPAQDAAPEQPTAATPEEPPAAPQALPSDIEKKPVLPSPVKAEIAKSFANTLGFLNPNGEQSKVFKIINQVTSASCFSLNCANFKGYAIVVSATENHKHPALTQIVKNKLNEYFRIHNIAIETFGAIQIQAVEFQPWAVSQAEVLEQSHFQGEEFAIAFFPAENIEPLFQESDVPDMVSLHMDELHGNIKTEFDLYLRLVKNGKFLLYTPKSGVFLQEQRDRLILNGIVEMYLKPIDKKFVYRYRAQNFLNKEIDKFFEYVEMRKKRNAS